LIIDNPLEYGPFLPQGSTSDNHTRSYLVMVVVKVKHILAPSLGCLDHTLGGTTPCRTIL